MPAANVGCWSVQARRDGVESIGIETWRYLYPATAPISYSKVSLQPWCSAWCSLSVLCLHPVCTYVCTYVCLTVFLYLHYKADLYAARVRGKA